MNSKKRKINRYPLLLAEDDILLAEALTEFLESEGYDVYHTRDCKGAISILEKNTIHISLLDKKLIDCEGTEIAEFIINKALKTKMILMTAYGQDKTIKEYISRGAFDFIEKPVNLAKLLKRIDNANRLFLIENTRETEVDLRLKDFKIVGSSPSTQRIRETVNVVAGHNSFVLIQGETGTGKELIARNIHLRSNRNDKMFLSINCASIPETLFESEFFGYEKGAFTGARNSKKGYFEIANYGVLHLDEIGEMPLGFQAKLLRVLESGTFIKLGGTKEMSVDVRIVASTNKNLSEEVKNGAFREDLYFRLAVFSINIPPLRERKEDIPLIAEHLWLNLQNETGKKPVKPNFSSEEFKEREWRGNVRELRNYLERKLIYFDLNENDIEIIPKEFDDFNISEDKIVPLEDYVKDYVLSILKLNGYNKTSTAKVLGMSISTLKRWMKKWGVEIKKTLN